MVIVGGDDGLPDGMDAGARVAPLPTLAPMYEEVDRAVLPAALALGLTTEEQAAAWSSEFARETADAHAHAALWPLLFGTWKRKEATR